MIKKQNDWPYNVPLFMLIALRFCNWLLWPTLTSFIYLILFFYCGPCYEETTQKAISYLITALCWWHMNLGTLIWRISARPLGFPVQTITSILSYNYSDQSVLETSPSCYPRSTYRFTSLPLPVMCYFSLPIISYFQIIKPFINKELKPNQIE